jgi:hypothetical protein
MDGKKDVWKDEEGGREEGEKIENRRRRQKTRRMEKHPPFCAY